MEKKIRVLIVDDAIVVRRVLTTLLGQEADIEVAGTAVNGRDALQKVPLLTPDLMILDVEMPEMNGLETMAVMRKEHPLLPVIMFSTLTTRGGAATLEALALGAKDYVTKPEGLSSPEQAMESVRQNLVPKIRAIAARGKGSSLGASAGGAVAGGLPPGVKVPVKLPPVRHDRIELLAIGSSTGGPNALSTLLSGLPKDFPVPIVITQHMPAVFTRMLAERLDSQLPFKVREASDGVSIAPGEVWIAPGDHHMIIERGTPYPRLRLNQQPPVNSCRPSVDVLFQSVAEVSRSHALTIVLTGMGHDGLDGCGKVREAGGQVVVQDEATSVVWGMPGYVARANLAEKVLPIDKIAAEIVARVSRRPGAPGTLR